MYRLFAPMDFVSVVLILLVYYIRPQDWVLGLIGVGIVTPIMAVAIFSMVSRAKQDGVALRFLLSPLDWGMLIYYGYIVVTHSYPYGAFKDALPLFAFYFVTVQALRTPQVLRKYMVFWLIALTTLALFGLLSKFGIDPTGAVDLTTQNKGRLALGTWMHNNPNSLGHSVIIIVPLAYLLFWWKQPVTRKVLAVLLFFLAFEVVHLTESKGAVLAGFATLVLAYIFGKSRLVQILVLVAAFAGGGAAISVMPRMSEMSNLRADEGVQGRLLAWEQARTSSRNSITGQGWKSFKATIRWQKLWLSKATHSGYVQVGGDMGPLGMFLYMGLFWLGIKSLIQVGAKVKTLDEECCRRCLFAILVGFFVSNWMIDRAYHTEFFLFFACISALHRMVLLQTQDPKTALAEKIEYAGSWESPAPARPLFPWHPEPALAVAGGGAMVSNSAMLTGGGGFAAAEPDPRAEGVSFGVGGNSPFVKIPEVVQDSWRRPTLGDAAVAAGAAWLVFFLWDYILKNL